MLPKRHIFASVTACNVAVFRINYTLAPLYNHVALDHFDSDHDIPSFQ